MEGPLAGAASAGGFSREPSTKDILASPNIVCQECGGKVFVEGVVLKKVSRLLTGASNDTLAPIPVYICAKCGAIPQELLSKANAKDILGEKDESPIVTEK